MTMRGFWMLGWACLVSSLLTGCGGGSKPKPDATAETAAEKPAAAKSQVESPSQAEPEEHEAAAAKPASKKSSEAPSIDGIPLDVVWHDDPYTLAQDKTPVGGPPAAGPTVAANNAAPKMEEKPAAPATAPAAAAGGSGDWASVINGESLVNETKKIRSSLKDALSSIGKYNSHYKEGIQVDAAVLASLAVVATNLPDGVSWKADAPTVRDLASDVSRKAKGLGQGPYDATKLPFEKLEGVLSGNKPPDLEAAAPTVPFSEVADRMPLMRRMDRAFNLLKSNINSDSIFKKQADTVQHELTILAALSKVCAAKDYASAAEEDYQKFLETMIKSCQEGIEASKAENFAAFGDALGKVQKACNECHGAYRFEN